MVQDRCPPVVETDLAKHDFPTMVGSLHTPQYAVRREVNHLLFKIPPPVRATPGATARTHTQNTLCGAVQVGSWSERHFCLTRPHTHSILVGNRCYRMSEGAMPTRCGPRPSCSITISPLCGGGAWGRLPRMGLRTGDVSARVRLHAASLYIYIHASMTGLARSPAHTASDYATNPHVLVSCSLGPSAPNLP